MAKPSAYYWDIKRTLSYNCLFNFIVGPRGAGKTYGSLKYVLTNLVPKHRQFMYVRRLESELDKLTKMRGGRLFNAIAKDPDLKGHALKAESNILYMDKRIIGYAQNLSSASILKSDSFPDVDLIIFDEFIIDNTGTYHYLKDEVRKFLDLYETVARGRDVKVFFLSNAVSVNNPYFDFFHLDKPHGGDIARFGESKDILVENVSVPDLMETKKQSRFGQIIKGTEYLDYAYDNDWLLDNTDFVERKTRRSEYFVSLRFNDSWLGIWFDNLQWIYYVSADVDKNSPRKYSITTDDQKPNLMLIKTASKLAWMKNLINAYRMGAVRYESVKLKSMFREIMRMIDNCR